MQCDFCGKVADPGEENFEGRWLPTFSTEECVYLAVLCPACREEHFFEYANEECVLKPGHAIPEGAIPMRKRTNPKFSLGQVVATPGALEALADAGQTPDFFLDMHVQGNWGEVCAEDQQANDEALVDGSRLLSAYRTLKNVRIWIITEATDDDGKRAATTILLPEEY